MKTQVEINDFASLSVGLLERVRNGEEITIADAGKPVAKIVPVYSLERVFNAYKGRVVVADDFDDSLPAEVIAAFEK